MKHELISEMKVDHKKLKELYKKGLKKTTSLEDKLEIFESLAPLVKAHAKSEEAVLYAPTCGMDETKHEALEGFEEHGLVELLLEEMKSEGNNDRWEAKFTVVCELLDHHIEEEEQEYFSKIKNIFSHEERIEMGKEYREMFSRLIDAQKNILEPEEFEHLRNH
ncbi:MAG: hemerythrin domain-containing protein [Bdellovibrionota bacterium]